MTCNLIKLFLFSNYSNSNGICFFFFLSFISPFSPRKLQLSIAVDYFRIFEKFTMDEERVWRRLIKRRYTKPQPSINLTLCSLIKLLPSHLRPQSRYYTHMFDHCLASIDAKRCRRHTNDVLSRISLTMKWSRGLNDNGSKTLCYFSYFSSVK